MSAETQACPIKIKIFTGCSVSNAFSLFPWKLQQLQRAQQHSSIGQILSCKKFFFSAVTAISYAFLSAMNKSLHAPLIKISTSRGDPLSSGVTAETHHPPPHCAHIHCLVSTNVQQMSMNVNGCNFFCTEEFNATPLLHLHSHVRHYCVRLPLCCHL